MGIFPNLRPQKVFPKLGSVALYHYGVFTSYKKSEKTNAQSQNYTKTIKSNYQLKDKLTIKGDYLGLLLIQLGSKMS